MPEKERIDAAWNDWKRVTDKIVLKNNITHNDWCHIFDKIVWRFENRMQKHGKT